MTPQTRPTNVLAAVVLVGWVIGQCTPFLRAQDSDSPTAEVVVFFPAHDSHRQAAAAIQQGLHDSGHSSILIEFPVGSDKSAQDQALEQLVNGRPKIIAAGGTKATSLALRALPQVPVVFFLVPNALDASFMAPNSPDRARLAGVTTDIAPERQIDLLTRLCPDVKKVGVLTSSRSERTASAIKAAGKSRSLSVIPIEADKNDFMSAITALKTQGCDAALMIPDARVYNSPSVQRLLLWGMRQKKPVLAFSSHVVKAGALAGLHCDNQGVGRQTARLIDQVLRGTDISSIGLQYPCCVSRALNERTADLIGIALDGKRMVPDTVCYESHR